MNIQSCNYFGRKGIFDWQWALLRTLLQFWRGNIKSMIIYKNNRLYSCNYKIYWLFFNFQYKRHSRYFCIILLHGTAFRQPLIKLYKHIVPQLLLWCPRLGEWVAACVCWYQGSWSQENNSNPLGAAVRSF